MTFRDLEPQEALAAMRSDTALRLLDVRTQPEHDSHRLPGSVLIPVQELHERLGELDADADWLVHCEHGRRSLWAIRMLQEAGFQRLANLRGGLAWWMENGLPVES
jgi:rhodanese-related sulfurtransferase